MSLSAYNPLTPLDFLLQSYDGITTGAIRPQTAWYQRETFEKCSILFKFKEGENFNRRNTLSILRIKI
jgi:hypothetical protein